MPGEEEDRVGSSALLAASSATNQQLQKQPSATATPSNIAATLDKLKHQLQQQQQQQQQQQSNKHFQSSPLQTPPPPLSTIPIISVNPSSVPTSGTPSVGGTSGSVGDILHHASIDEDEDDMGDEDDITDSDLCGSNSKLELELQFAADRPHPTPKGVGSKNDVNKNYHRKPSITTTVDKKTLELTQPPYVEQVENNDGGLKRPPPGRRRVSSAQVLGSQSTLGGGGGGLEGSQGVVGAAVTVGGDHLPHEGLEEEGENEDVEGGKAPSVPAEPEEPTFAEKFLFYTTAFFILLAVFSLFAFMFLVPFVIDPAFTTIFMKFDPEPVMCRTESRINQMGQNNCSWTSCREGCTREIFNCTQIFVVYYRKSTAAEMEQLKQQQPPPKTLNLIQQPQFGVPLSQSSAYTSYYSSYSKSTRSQHDPGTSFPGVRWDTYPNHIYQSTNNNNNNNINNNKNKQVSKTHYHYLSYPTTSNNAAATNNNNNNPNNVHNSNGDANGEGSDGEDLMLGGSRGRSSRAAPLLLGDNSDRNSMILNGNHKKKKHKVIPSSSNANNVNTNDYSNNNNNNNNNFNLHNLNILSSENTNSELIPRASSLTSSSSSGGGGGGGISSRSSSTNSKGEGGGGGGVRGESQALQFIRAKLHPNVKGCGYPPVINCTTFFKKYGTVGANFSCYYSRVKPNLVVTSFDMDQVVKDLVFSLAIPIPSFIISVIYLIFAYYRIYNMDSSSNPPPASSETANSSNPHDNHSTNGGNNNLGGSTHSGGGGGGGGIGGGSVSGSIHGGEPEGETSLSTDDKTRIIQRSTSRGLNALSELIPNSAKAVQPLIQMKDLASSHLPPDGDLILPRRNNRAPERNGPTNPQAKNKGVVQIQVQAQKESDSRKSSLDCSPMTSSQLQNTIPEPGEEAGR